MTHTWDTSQDPIEDLNNAAEIIREKGKLKPLTLLEKVFEANTAYIWSLSAFDDNEIHMKYYKKFNDLRVEYYKSNNSTE